MKYGLLIGVVLTALSFWVGCRAEPEVISLAPPEVGSAREQPQPGAPELGSVEPIQDPERKPRFIAADEARPSPKLMLQTFEGKKVEIQPGRVGRVMLVVFWSMDIAATKAAARYARDLGRLYGPTGLDVVGVVEKTKAFALAPAFLRAYQIEYPMYYDDYTALRKMAGAARVSVGNETPCFFLIDRALCVRLFKRGFSFTSAVSVEPPGAEAAVIENAAPGESLEDYVRQLLSGR